MVRLMSILWVAAAIALLVGCQPDQSGGLTFRAPARVLQAVTSTDADLCERLAVDFTMLEVGAAGAIIDREPLVSSAVCEWSLEDEETLIARGDYRLLVRLLGAGGYTGRAACEDDNVSPLWLGAYWIEEVSFPFPADFAGFSDDRFISTATEDGELITIEQRVGFGTPSFDVDADGLDNLIEFAGDSNPCVPNQPPQILLSASPLAATEGEPVTIQVSTDEPGGLQHDVVVTLQHGFGSEYPPEQTEVVLRAYDPDNVSLPAALPGQDWSLQATVLDARPESATAASWELTFLPEEPFVGPVTLTAHARQRGGGPSFSGAPAPLTLVIEDTPDPVRILLEDDDGVLAVATRLDFAELGAEGAPTTLRLRAESQDIGVQVNGTLLAPSVPPGMVVGQDLSFTTLTWEPDNTAAAQPPAGGHEVGLVFQAESGEEFETTLTARVTPTFNDAPRFGDLATVNGNLSPEDFELKRFSFDVIDPDRVEGSLALEPACSVEVWPEGDQGCATACCGAFTSITCETDGDLVGDTWRMAATLVPAADYFTRCGARPTFVAKLSVTDRAPSDAAPLENKSVETSSSCSSGNDCWEHITLSTADVTQALVVSGWGGDLTGSINGTTSALVHGGTGMALMGVYLKLTAELSGSAVVAVVDLSEPPTVMRVYADTELERLSDFLNYLPAGVVDEVNNRAVSYSRVDGVASMAVADLEAPFDVQTWPMTDFCPSCSNTDCGSSPVVDANGTVWVPCGRSGEGDLVRIDALNNRTVKNLAPAVDGANGVPGSAILEDENGVEWLLWPDNLGVAVINLATFDDANPVVLRGTMSAEYSDNRVEGFGVSPDRREAYFAYNQATGDSAEIARVRVEAGAPVVSAPIVFGAKSNTSNGSSFHRVLVRPPAPGAPSSEPDLIITGGGGAADERPMIDVDSWTLVPFPRPADDYAILGIKELYASPDPAYYAAVVNGSALKGLVLYPWDLDQPPLEQDLGVPSTGEIKQTWVTISQGANKLVISKTGEVVVIDFPGAP